MTKLLKEFFLTNFSSSIVSIKEEMGLARGIKIAEAFWKRLAEDFFPIINKHVETEGQELAGLANFLGKVFSDILEFENIETRTDENAVYLRLNDCPFWQVVRENKLPPVAHNLCTIFIETLARLKNPALIFDKIACKSMAQGGKYCEFVWKRF